MIYEWIIDLFSSLGLFKDEIWCNDGENESQVVPQFP